MKESLPSNGLLIPTPVGTTRLYAILGDPISQVKAPPLFNRLFLDGDVDAVMVPLHVRAQNLDVVMQALAAFENLDGLVVTIPHKLAVSRYLERLCPAAELSGAVNAVRRDSDGRWTGDNVDGAGFVAGMRRRGHEPRGKRVALFGTGGAGVAIAAALVDAEVEALIVNDLDMSRAIRIADRLNAWRPGAVEPHSTVDLAGIDIAVNATPLGLRPEDPLPFEPDELPAHATVVDIIMNPHDTALLKKAADRGLAVHHGKYMLEAQIEMFRKFFGLPAVANSSGLDLNMRSTERCHQP